MTLSLNLRLLFQGKMHKKGFKQSFCYFVIAARWRDWVLPRGLCKVKSREIKMAGWTLLTPPPCCTSKKDQDRWREISEMLKTLLIEGHKNGAASKKFCQFRFRTTFYFLLSVLHALRLGLRSGPFCVILNKIVFSFSKSYWIKKAIFISWWSTTSQKCPMSVFTVRVRQPFLSGKRVIRGHVWLQNFGRFHLLLCPRLTAKQRHLYCSKGQNQVRSNSHCFVSIVRNG